MNAKTFMLYFAVSLILGDCEFQQCRLINRLSGNVKLAAVAAKFLQTMSLFCKSFLIEGYVLYIHSDS